MSSIHYRFRSSSEYETITFDGPSITVHELREAIMESNRMAKSPSHTLEITNAQTKEVYQLDSFMVPKNSSVVVKRVPLQRHEAVTAATSGLSKEEEELTEMALAKLIQAPNLSNVEAPEDDKIKAMHKQATDVFDPRQYSTIRRAPANYQCFRCNGKGHFLRDCPTQGDPRYNNSQYNSHRGTVPSGIPKAYFLMRMKQEEQLLVKLREMQPGNSRFSPVVGSDVVDHSKIPSELQCPMCKKLFTDVVVTPCCGFSYCDECIRNHLIDNDLTCVCKETTSPDNLIANKSLRISVSNYRNQKKDLKSVPPSPVANMPATSGSPHKSNDAAIVAQHAISEQVAVSQPPQIPPEATPENSQALTNGVIGLEGQTDTDAIDNSPKKLLQDSQERNNSPLAVPNGNGQIAASQHVVMPASNAQVVTSQVGPVTQIHGSMASQVLPHPFAGPALYSNVQPPLRPGIILPPQQRHIVPHPHPQPVVAPPHPIGINIPPGATVFKRLAMVPVGPRVAPNPMALPPHHGPARMMGPVNVRPPHMDQIRARTDHVSKTHDKHRGKEAASPMPLTEAEFNSIKKKFLSPPVQGDNAWKDGAFKRWHQRFPTVPSRRRHRSTSADESSGRELTRGRERSLSASRSRSRSPPPPDNRSKRHGRSKDGSYSPNRKKKYDSADDSSQERRRKDKSKRRNRDSSLGSVASSKGESSSAPKSRSSRGEKKQKTRELPEHIKREIDEFEFDNELEFDEEYRNLRKKQKSKSGEMSTPERSPSPPVDFKCETATDAIDMAVHQSPTLPDVEKPMTEESPVSLKDNVNDKPTGGTGGNVLEKSADQKVDSVSQLLSPNKASVPQVSADGKPKKKKIIKKVVRLVKVTRKKAKVGPDGQPLTSPDAPTSETTTPTEPPKTESDTTKTPDTPITPVDTAAPVLSETAPEKNEDVVIDTAVVDEANVSGIEAPLETSNCAATSECDQAKSENEASFQEVDPSVSENDMSLIDLDQPKLGHDASVVEIEPPPQAEDVPQDQLPENSRWETAPGKPKTGRVKSKSESHDGRSSPSPKKPRTLNLHGVSPSKKKSRKEAQEKSAEKVAALKATKMEGSKPMSKEKLAALKQMHCTKSKIEKSKITSDAVVAKKEAEKRSSIEKRKKMALAVAEKASKAEGMEGMSAQEAEERKKKIEKYFLMKKQRAKERLLAERQKAKKLEAGGGEVPPKPKTKSRRSDESDHGAPGEEQQHQRRPDVSGSYKPADAKLKSISEITKKRLKQSEGGVEGTKKHSSNEVEDDSSDVLKSKVTSIKTVIGGAEKRRVIKTSVSEEREYPEVYPEDVHVRRVIKVGDENRKKSLVSKVEKSEKGGRGSDQEKRRHREDEREQLRDRDESIDRERYERRVRLREEETMRREMKDKIRSQREMEKEMREKDEQRLKSLEKEKLESLERERLANKEREKLERKLKRERQLREDMIREKEEKLQEEEEKINDRRRREAATMEKKRYDKRKVQAEGSEEHNSDDHKNNKRTKKDKNKPGYIIQIIDSEKSDSESDSTDADDREKKRKKKKKKSKDKKKRRKKTEDNKSDEKAETEESSDDEKEEEEKKRKKRKKEDSEGSSGGDDDDRKKKRRKKHKKKHKKHKKLKKTKKKSKKSKKSKKEKESESESDTEQQTQSGEESADESAATGSGKDEDGDDAGKSSSSSDGESAASSSSEKKEESPPSKAACPEPSSSKARESRSKQTSPGACGDHDPSGKGSRESTASQQKSRSKEKSGTPKSEKPSEKSLRRSDEPSNERSSGKPSDERISQSNERSSDRTTERRSTDRPSERRSNEKSNERPSDRLSTEGARSERRSNERSNERTSERLSTERSNERSPKKLSERPVERSSERPSRDSTDHQRNDREKGASSKTSKSTTSKSKDKEVRNELEHAGKARQERRSDMESKTESQSRSEAKSESNAKEKSHSRREAPSSRSRKEQSRNDQESKKSDDRRVERRKDSTRGDAKKDRLPSSSSQAALKRNDMVDELELDYNDADLELEDDVYNDLGFADDEQTNPDASDENKRTKKRSEEFEDGEILDEDLYAASGRETKKSKKYDDGGSTDDTETEGTEEDEDDEEDEPVADEPSDVEANEHDTNNISKITIIDTSAIESAVDDEIDKLDIEEEECAEEEEEDEGLEEDGEDEEVEEEEEEASSPPPKVKRTRTSSDAANKRPPRVLRKR